MSGNVRPDPFHGWCSECGAGCCGTNDEGRCNGAYEGECHRVNPPPVADCYRCGQGEPCTDHSAELARKLAPDAKAAAIFLFDLLDSIDTVSDIAKGDDAAFRREVERIHRRRFEVATTDGYTVTLRSDR